MQNEKMENLIRFALVDGELNEKERAILFKKAKEEGIDLDEFELFLNAKLYETQQNAKHTENSSSKSKNGEIQRSALHAEQLQSHLQLLALTVV